MGSSISRPVDVKVELFKWSSEEFPQEIALIYTSHSNASRTSTSHFSANRQKVLFKLDDCLCEGNPVRVDLEIKVERDDEGNFKFVTPKPGFRGLFSERRLKPNETLLSYQDIFGARKGQFYAYSSRVKYVQDDEIFREEWTISHSLFSRGEKILMYFWKMRCDPKNGLEVELRGPFCFKDSSVEQLGHCYIDGVVSGKPPNISNKEEKGVAVSHGKQERPPLILPAEVIALFRKMKGGGNDFNNEGNIIGDLNGSTVNVTVNYH